MAATIDVLRDRGIARLTTREIAARMGISEGSIFYHFGDRKGLIQAVFEDALRPLWQYQTMPLTEPSSLAEVTDTLIAFNRSIGEFLGSALDILLTAQADTALRGEVFAVMAENDFGPQRGIAAITGYLEAAQRVGIADADADVVALAHLLVASDFMRHTQPRLLGHDRGALDLERLVAVVIDALTPRDQRSRSIPDARSLQSTSSTSARPAR